MGLGDLTDRTAVIKAVDEFDRLGRDDFLNKYGFGPATRYFLLYRGARYDSKAIAGVAYGYQHPIKGRFDREISAVVRIRLSSVSTP